MPRSRDHDLNSKQLQDLMVNGSQFTIRLPFKEFRKAYALRCRLYAVRSMLIRADLTLAEKINFECVFVDDQGQMLPKKFPKELPMVMLVRPRDSDLAINLGDAIAAGAKAAGKKIEDGASILPQKTIDNAVAAGESPAVNDLLKELGITR